MILDSTQVLSEEQELRRLSRPWASCHCRFASSRPQKIAAFYQQFVFALRPKDVADPALDAARSKLVRRLLLLPG